MTLNELPTGQRAIIERVDGERSFRRRLLELGLLPGSEIQLLRVAPLGDPIEIWTRGANLSIRAHEARGIRVRPSGQTTGTADTAADAPVARA